MVKTLSTWALGALGWSITGHPPTDVAKAVVIVMPHTSNWDFPLGLLVRRALGLRIQFVGKHTLFRPPFGWFFRALGGHPVDRTRASSQVDQIIELYNTHDHFLLTITPEGTRKKVPRIKSGFYHIASGAGVPIIMVRFDFARREVNFSEPFHPTGDKDRDMAFILEHFRGVQGKHPALGVDEHTTY